MSKSIQAPRAPKHKVKTKKLKPIKTYTSKDGRRIRLRRILAWLFGIILFIIVILSAITAISGPIKLSWVKPPKLETPNSTKLKILHINKPSENLIKHIKVTSENNAFEPIYKKDIIELPLKEGINNYTISYLYDFKLFKFKSLDNQIQIVRDTIAPQLLKKPTLTNQGLVLEFTEPAKIIVNNRIYKTDGSYTVVIPQKSITSSTLNLSVSDNLGNKKIFKIVLKKVVSKNGKTQFVVSGTTLPKSAGLQDFLNIPLFLLLAIVIGAPYTLVNVSLKILRNKA